MCIYIYLYICTYIYKYICIFMYISMFYTGIRVTFDAFLELL